MSGFQNLIAYWQNSLSVNLGIERKPGRHTEMHNLIIDQLHYSTLVGTISFEAADLLVRSHLKEHENAVDRVNDFCNPESDYAERALKFAGSHKQNSKLWKSNLDASAVLRNSDSYTASKQFMSIDDDSINLLAKHFPAKFSSIVLDGEKENFSGAVKEECRVLEGTSQDSKRKLASPNWEASKKPSTASYETALRQHLSFGEVQMKKTNLEQNAPRENEVTNCGEMMSFKTAKQQYLKNQQKRLGQPNSRSLFLTKNRPSHHFVQPSKLSSKADRKDETEVPLDERMKNIDPKMIELMISEIMDHGPPVTWDDIAGLEFAKTTIKEIVIWPMLRPDLFTGLRGPPKGVLLFGPPGTGKTLIGKCIASQTKSTFFSISASSLTSKWVGEGEKLVKALFTVARCHQPAVIFIDEIDSLLTQRSESEHESSRRIKTEFLVQLDGATTSSNERLLVVGATNRPQELDEALRRRLVKRLYIPLPELEARRQIVRTLLKNHSYALSNDDFDIICKSTDGYSGSDMANLCKEAALGPIRRLNFSDIEHIKEDEVEPIVLKDFMDAMKQVRASVSQKDLQCYVEWNEKFGSSAISKP